MGDLEVAVDRTAQVHEPALQDVFTEARMRKAAIDQVCELLNSVPLAEIACYVIHVELRDKR